MHSEIALNSLIKLFDTYYNNVPSSNDRLGSPVRQHTDNVVTYTLTFIPTMWFVSLSTKSLDDAQEFWMKFNPPSGVMIRNILRERDWNGDTFSKEYPIRQGSREVRQVFFFFFFFFLLIYSDFHWFVNDRDYLRHC